MRPQGDLHKLRIRLVSDSARIVKKPKTMRNSALLACLLSTACTGVINTGDDPSGDPSGTPPPPSTSVELTVRDGQSPQPGVSVIFQHADGSLAAEVTTDASGVAATDLPDGGSITVIRSFPAVDAQTPPPPNEVYTYVGVKAGDHLALGRTTDAYGTASAVLVNMPTGTNGTVKVAAPCGGGQGTGPQVAITVHDCNAQIGIYAEDGGRSALFKRVAFGENIDLSMEQLVGPLTSTISAINVTPGTTVTVEERLGADGVSYYSTGAKRVDATLASVTLPPLHDMELLSLVTVSGNGQTQVVANRAMYTSDTSTVDASAGLISSVTAVKYAAGDITWTEDGPGADAVLAALHVSPKAAGTDPYVRMILAPHGGPALTVPMLVGSAAAYNPVTGDQISTQLGLVQLTGGYDALRARGFADDQTAQLAPMNGSLTLSYAGSAPTAAK